MSRAVLAAAVAALLPLGAMGAGPLGLCNPGSGNAPLKYNGNSVTLHYDGGGTLGGRTKAQADAIINNAIALWNNAPSASLVISRGANLPVDVTSSNYTAYIGGGTYGDGRNPVVYDTDGSIIDAMLGTGARSSVLGFAGSAWFGAPTCRYAEGQAVINGSIPITDTRMTMVIAHELGHLVGLDHTQLDATQGLASGNYPLMYPVAYRSTATLHEDDQSSVTLLYPEAAHTATYGQLTGTLTHAGVPVRGANIWARETTTNRLYSVVSDYLARDTGSFKLLLPAGTYSLAIEAIASDFNGGSSVGPHSSTYPSSYSFLSPLYVSGAPMAPVDWGGSSPKRFTIVPGCAATLALTLQGGGTVAGDCEQEPAPPPEPPPPPPAGSVPGDADIVYRNFATGQLHGLRMGGLSVSASHQMHVEPDLGWSVVARADFNADGAPDLLWRDAASGMVTMQFYDASNRPAGVGYVWTEPDPAWRVVQTPDLDGDDRADLVWWNGATGQVYAMLMNGAAIKAHGMVHTEPDTQWRIVASGDFAGTGIGNQLVWHHLGNGTVYRMNVTASPFGFSVTGGAFYREADTGWRILGAADFNGDAKQDLLWRHGATGQVYVMLLADTLVLGGGVIHTEPDPAWQVAALGDYDGNGRKDLLWRNEATGALFMMLMNELTILKQGVIYNEPRLEWRVLGLREYSR